MQFADLMCLFREGQNEGRKRGYVSQGACDAEGIAAVIRAVRDEFGRIMYPGDDWNRQGILEQFDQILGDPGNKKVADTVAQAVEPLEVREVTGASPVRTATDPAPAVCEWKGYYSDGLFKWSITCSYTEVLRQRYDDERGPCGYCGLPIKFTEAK